MVTKISDFLNTTFSTLTLNDAVNNSVVYPGTIVHTTTGTPGAGIGAGIIYQVETSNNNNEYGMTLETVTTDVTAGSEDFDFVVKLMQNGAAAGERLRLNSAGQLTSYAGMVATSFTTTGTISTGSVTDAAYTRIVNPGGGAWSHSTPTVTGALAITLPVAATNTMIAITIKVYEYVTNESFELHVGGYAYSVGNTWANNPFAYIVGNPSIDRRFNVRLGYTAGGKMIIYIGETTDTWSYPQVFVTEVLCGYSGQSTSYLSGWSVGVATTFENVTATIQSTDIQVGYAVSTNTANSVVKRDGSGNFSAGTITGTAGVFSTSLYGAAFNTAGTATVNALVSNVYGRFGQNVTVNSTNVSTSTTTGALVVGGGVGIAGNLYAGGNVVAASLQPTSASVPASGLYLPAANTLGFSTNSVERMRITSTGNVVIGTSASMATQASLMVSGNTSNGAVALAALDAATISIKNDSVGSLNLTSKLNFNVASIGASVVAGYYAVFNASNDIGTGLLFGTQTNAAGGTVERMRIDHNGNVGINNTSPLYRMHVNNVATVGTVASVLANASPMVYLDNGSGIGGSIVIKTHSPGNGNQAGALKFAVSPDSTNYNWAGVAGIADNNAAASTLAFYTAASNVQGTAAGASTERMRIDVNGYVGIATTAAGSTLDVNGNASFRSAISAASTATVSSLVSNGAVSGTTGTFSSALYSASFNTAGTATINSLVSNGAVTGTSFIPSGATVPTNGMFLPAANNVGFSTNSGERARIDATGNIGIGTTIPRELLHLNNPSAAGDTPRIKFTNTNTGGGAADGGFVGISNQNQIDVWNNEASLVRIGTSGTERMRVDAIGNVSIGTNLVGAASGGRISLTVNGTTGSLLALATGDTLRGYVFTDTANMSATCMGGTMTVQTAAAQPVIFATNSTERMRIDSVGNVGIGTSTIQTGYKLQVEGDFAATTKSFVINHPTKPGKMLRYGSLESPYHGVRLTGEAEVIDGKCTVDLPDYISGLCHQEGSQVQITNIRHGKTLWIHDIDIENNRFTVKTRGKGKYRFYWSFTAIRKDIEDMLVEFDKSR